MSSTPHSDLIGAELSRLSGDEAVKDTSLFRILTASQTLLEASLQANPEPLWLTLWYQGEVCILFADSNQGKSIYAVQIATSIAQKQKIILFDFELSSKQFQLRYTDEATGTLYNFPENLYRVEINQDAMLDVNDNFEDAIIRNIESAVIGTGAKVIVIDNISYLCSASEKGDLAGILMMRLIQLKRKHSLSILVLAHTPKRPLSMPLTQNDLAGSKKLFNFCDSCFAIGQSAKDSNLKYIKQLKVRYGGYTYDSSNVIVAQIEKVGAFLQFTTIGYGTESEHLNEQSEVDKQIIIDEAKRLSGQGLSIREVAKQLGISKSKIGRILNK